MRCNRLGATTLAILLVAIQATSLPPAAAAQQAAADTIWTWGDVTDGLQLIIAVRGNSIIELSTETQLLYMNVAVRNVSDRPVSVNFGPNSDTYDFEYEIDGTWYAFERMESVRTPLSVMRADRNYAAVNSSLLTIEPGSGKGTMLNVPFAGRSRSLQLFAITASGLGRRFEPTPGVHVIRIRPGRTLDSTRRAPVSNPITVVFRTPAQLDTLPQSVTFTFARDTPLREFRFVSGPADGQEFLRKVLARPPYPSVAAGLIPPAALEVDEPIQLYQLNLTRRADPPNQTLPTPLSRASWGESQAYYYLVRSSDQLAGFIGLDTHPDGSVDNSIGLSTLASDAVFRALRQLAQSDEVRGGNYEPRLVQVIGVLGARPPWVFWLHSTSGRPDLFYRPRDPEYHGFTKVESEKLYAIGEFLAAAKELPSEPRFDEKWAISVARACATADWPAISNVLLYEQAVTEIGLSGESVPGPQAVQDERLGWYVYFPERENRLVRRSHTGATFFIDETTGACRIIRQG